MGSIDCTYTLCSKCNGLFSEAHIGAEHARACQGNISESNCLLVACDKTVFLKHVLPVIKPPIRKNKGGRPRKRPPDESTEGTPDTKSQEAKRPYGLRRKVAAALHTKMTDMHKALGVQKRGSMEQNEAPSLTLNTENQASTENVPLAEVPAKVNRTEVVKKLLQKLKPASPKSAETLLQTQDESEKTIVVFSEAIVDGGNDAGVESQTVYQISQNSELFESTPKKASPMIADGEDSSPKNPQKIHNKEIKVKGNKIRVPITEIQLESNPEGGNSGKGVELVEIWLAEHDDENEEDSEMNFVHEEGAIPDVLDNDGEEMDATEEQSSDEHTGGQTQSADILQITRSADGIYRCELCDYNSPKLGIFRRHMSSHNDGKMYTCPYCDMKFLYRRFYRQHLGTHDGKECKYCHKKFSRLHDLKRHINALHTAEHVYQCEQCEYKTRHHHLINDHKRKHTNFRYGCPVPDCGFQSIYRRALNHHVKTIHGSGKNLECRSCSYRTNDSSAMHRHLKVHDKATNNTLHCESCDYSASTMAAMKGHMLSHSEDKVYQCDQCDFSCVRGSGIRSHLMKHIGVKPWACPQCPYVATARNKIQRHINLKHQGDGQPVRQKVSVRFDTNAYRINKSTIPMEAGEQVHDQVTVEGDSTLPKYVVIEMIDGDQQGSALGSNLVGREVVVSGSMGPEEVDTDVSQEAGGSEEGEVGEEEDSNQTYLYKCEVCSRVDSDLNVIREHMDADHEETVTLSDPTTEALSEIQLAHLLEAAATTGKEHEEQSVSETVITDHEGADGVHCIYQTADGTVLNTIDVGHVSDHQIVSLQDDAVSTAVESILHLQNIPIKET